MKKILITGIVGTTIISGSVYATTNSVFPTIPVIFTENNINKTLFIGESSDINLKNIIKNISEINAGNNIIKYNFKNINDNYFSYNQENQYITIQNTTPKGEYTLNYEVCTEGKKNPTPVPELREIIDNIPSTSTPPTVTLPKDPPPVTIFVPDTGTPSNPPVTIPKDPI